MNRYLLLLGFFIFTQVGFSQSMEELQEQMIAMTSEKQKLIAEKQELLDDVLNLKQQIIDLKTEYENLRAATSTGNITTSNPAMYGLIAPDYSESQSTIEWQAIDGKGTQFSQDTDPGSKYRRQNRKNYDSGITQRIERPSFPTSIGSNITPAGRAMQVGPRGERYYSLGNGSRVYTRR